MHLITKCLIESLCNYPEPHQALQQRRFAGAVDAEDDRPRRGFAFAIGEVEFLLFAEATDVFDLQREQICRQWLFGLRFGVAVFAGRLGHDCCPLFVFAPDADAEAVEVELFGFFAIDGAAAVHRESQE